MLLRSRILVFQLIFTGRAVNVAVDLRGEYIINPSLRVQARIVNLFDKDYETAYLYNQTGRAGYLTLRYGF